MSEDDNQNNNAADQHPVIGPWTGRLKAQDQQNQFMKHEEGPQTVILNGANPQDPDAPRMIIKQGSPVYGGR